MWVGENESAKFWATVLNGLCNRGVEDIFIACTDNLNGFSYANAAVYPKTDIQNCIIHQLRNSSKYVSYKDLKALMADLKAVYAAPDEASALAALEFFSGKWDKKYPKISQSWQSNWANLSTYFKFPAELRKLIYTANAIEGFNRQLRKVTKYVCRVGSMRENGLGLPDWRRYAVLTGDGYHSGCLQKREGR